MSLRTVLTSGRRAAEMLMTDTCTVTRESGTPVLNETTQQYETPTTTVYTGVCQVQSGALMSAGRESGDTFALINRVVVKLPITAAGIASGDSVTVNTAGDLQLVGASFRVRSVDDKSHATCRRLEVEEA